MTATEQQGPDALYSIGSVAKMLRVPTSTLRALETRYRLVKPQRSGGFQRLYSRNQVDQLRFIKAHLDLGLRAADAHRLLAEKLGTRRAQA